MDGNRKAPPADNTTTVVNHSRRGFLKTSAGLTLAMYLSPLLAAENPPAQLTAPPPLPDIPPDAFLRIAPDGAITVISKHLEMGQGTFTGLATLIAEELDADWSKVSVEGAPADVTRYGNLAWGGAVQGTGGSSAMAAAWIQMRTAGASARAMLVSAAAARWKVDEGSITVSKSVLTHAPTGRKLGFGDVAEEAAKLPVPKSPKLKPAVHYTLIGKEGVRRTDSASKTDGSAMFTQDVQLPDMLVAVIAHPPRFGGVIASVDDAAARAVPGVVDVLKVAGTTGVFQGGVAVLAKDTWTAIKASKLLKIQWDDSAAGRVDSKAQTIAYRELAKTPGAVALSKGDCAKALQTAARTLEAEYEVPYLAHASMEPLNCVVHLREDAIEVWNGEQFHTIDQGALAAAAGLKPEQVQIHQLYAGGSFGRRASPKSDYLLETLAVAKLAVAAGHTGPVKLIWTREDDTVGGYYRPHTLHAVKAALDKDGKLIGWWQRIVGQSIAKGSPFEGGMVRNGVDATSVEGVADLPFNIANIQAELHSPDVAVPVQWWRSVGHTHTAFVVQAFVDEVARNVKMDPVAYRRALLGQHPRESGVLEMAARRAGWMQPLAKKPGLRRGRGVAVHKSFDTYVAQVVEVSVSDDGQFKVDRVVCAVDCGVVINPDVVRAQMEGGIGYGLSAAMHGEITLSDGIVDQNNFHTYRPLRIHEMPAIEVHMVVSAAAPTGVGEPGTAVIAPALVNALFDATGVRIRRLPVNSKLLAKV
jgi:isoquinoline 1-oxidoreductase beta subunit